MLKHLPPISMDFISHCQSFLVCRFLSLYLENIFYYSYPSLSRFLPAYLSHLLRLIVCSKHHSIVSRLFFFLESNCIPIPRQAGFRPGQYIFDQIVYLSQSISDGFNKPKLALGQFLQRSTSPRHLTLFGILLFFISLFRPTFSFLCSLDSFFPF